MKKIKRYTTTEFYNNPSKVLNFVRDGGTAYLGYKRVKEPLAVLTSYKDYRGEGGSVDKRKSLWERYGHKAISSPEYKDSAKYIREQRDLE